MSDLQRIRQLAGLTKLNESVSAMPEIGHQPDLEEAAFGNDEPIRSQQNEIDFDEGSQGMEETIELGDNNEYTPAWYIVRNLDNMVADGPFEHQQEAARLLHGARNSHNPGKYSVAFGIEDMGGAFVDDTHEPAHMGEDAEVEEAYDMQNGYNDTYTADPEDYFPSGADGPVTSNVGPSGARQGDNPEQKKMQIAETHKELVYSYRKFLKESTKK
jgi:hypothetical protein